MKRRERGSAMLIAVVVVLILTAVAGTLLTEVLFRQRETAESRDADEAMIIARAGLEKARLFLHSYYTTDVWDPALVDGPSRWASILNWINFDADGNPANGISGNFGGNFDIDNNHRVSSTNVADIWANYLLVRDNPTFSGYIWGQQTLGSGISAAVAKTDPGVIFCQNKPYRNGAYHVMVRDNNDDADPMTDIDQTLIVTVTATLPDGTQRQIESTVLIEFNVFNLDDAVLSASGLKINGNPQVSGTQGNAHANGNLNIVGNPTVQGDATASGTISVSGGPVVGGVFAGSQPEVPLPDVAPSDYAQDRDYHIYEVGNTAYVEDGAGNVLATLSNNQEWNGIRYSKSSGSNPPSFSIPGDTPPPNGTYHIGGDFQISGDPGTIASPFQATWLVEGSVRMTGQPNFTPALGDLSIVAGKDIELQGNAGVNAYNGVFIAGEQIGLGGNPTLNGAILALDKADTDNSVSRANISPGYAAITIGGDPTIIYNGGITIGEATGGQVEVVNIRRIR